MGMPSFPAARDLTTFSAKVLGGRIVDALSWNIDFVLIGRLLGSSALGFYSMAWDLLRFIPDRVFRIAGRVALPTFCHLQDDTEHLARAYLSFCGYLSRIILPIILCSTIAAPELISVIYGPKWLPAAGPMELLSCALMLVGLRVAIGSIYYAKNHPEFDFYLHGVGLVLVFVAVRALACTGLLGVSAGVSAAESFISIAGQGLVCVLIGISLKDIFVSIMPGVRLALMCALGVIAGKFVASLNGANEIETLFLVVVPPAAIYCWCESTTAMRMLADMFGRDESIDGASPIVVAEEMQ